MKRAIKNEEYHTASLIKRNLGLREINYRSKSPPKKNSHKPMHPYRPNLGE